MCSSTQSGLDFVRYLGSESCLRVGRWSTYRCMWPSLCSSEIARLAFNSTIKSLQTAASLREKGIAYTCKARISVRVRWSEGLQVLVLKEATEVEEVAVTPLSLADEVAEALSSAPGQEVTITLASHLCRCCINSVQQQPFQVVVGLSCGSGSRHRECGQQFILNSAGGCWVLYPCPSCRGCKIWVSIHEELFRYLIADSDGIGSQ